MYQASDGSRLITDHARIEPGYELVKVYSDSEVWYQTGRSKPRASFKPRPSAYDDLIRDTAHQVSLDPMLIKSVMHAESAFRPDAVSHKGASGLMQLMPGTARRYGVSSIFDPRENVLGGARYLSDLIERFEGNLEWALAGYNAGENAVIRTGGIPPYEETRTYVKRVMGLYREYRKKGCEQHIADAVSFEGEIISCSASGGGSTIGNLDLEMPESQGALLADDSGWRHVE